MLHFRVVQPVTGEDTEEAAAQGEGESQGQGQGSQDGAGRRRRVRRVRAWTSRGDAQDTSGGIGDGGGSDLGGDRRMSFDGSSPVQDGQAAAGGAHRDSFGLERGTSLTGDLGTTSTSLSATKLSPPLKSAVLLIGSGGDDDEPWGEKDGGRQGEGAVEGGGDVDGDEAMSATAGASARGGGGSGSSSADSGQAALATGLQDTRGEVRYLSPAKLRLGLELAMQVI